MNNESYIERAQLLKPFMQALRKGATVFRSTNGFLQGGFRLVGSRQSPREEFVNVQSLSRAEDLVAEDFKELLLFASDPTNAQIVLVHTHHKLTQYELCSLDFPPLDLKLMLPTLPRVVMRPSMGCVFSPQLDAPEAYVGWKCPICERFMMWQSQLSKDYFYMTVPYRSHQGIAHVAIICPNCKLRTYYTNKPEQLYPNVQRLRTLRLT